MTNDLFRLITLDSEVPMEDLDRLYLRFSLMVADTDLAVERLEQQEIAQNFLTSLLRMIKFYHPYQGILVSQVAYHNHVYLQYRPMTRSDMERAHQSEYD